MTRGKYAFTLFVCRIFWHRRGTVSKNQVAPTELPAIFWFSCYTQNAPTALAWTSFTARHSLR